MPTGSSCQATNTDPSISRLRHSSSVSASQSSALLAGSGLEPQRFQANTLENGNVINTEDSDQSALHSTPALLFEMVEAARLGFRQKENRAAELPGFQAQKGNTSSFRVRCAFRGRGNVVTIFGNVFCLFLRLADALHRYDLLIFGG